MERYLPIFTQPLKIRPLQNDMMSRIWRRSSEGYRSNKNGHELISVEAGL